MFQSITSNRYQMNFH